MTQIMEGSSASRPVPATEDIIDNLPREVILEDSKSLSFSQVFLFDCR